MRQLLRGLENKPHLVALALAGCVALGSLLASYYEWRRYATLDDEIEQSRLFAEHTENLLSLLKDAESGLRGYLIAGNSRYLRPYSEAVPSIRERLSKLIVLGEDSHNTEQAQKLSQLVRNELAELEQSVQLVRRGGFDEALQAVKAGRGNATMDEVRELGRTISQSSYARIRAQSVQARSNADRIRLILLLGSALVAVLLALSTIRLRRLIRARDESRKIAEQMFESNPQPMWVYDPDSLKFLAVNDAAVHSYGYTRDEFLNMTLRDIRPEEEVPGLLKNARNLSAIVHSDGPWIHRKKDGSLIHVEITAHPIDLDNKKARFIMANDVTERLEAEDALRRSEEEYRAIVETASDAIVQIDEQSNIIFASRHAETIFGWAPADLVGRRLTALMPERLQKPYTDKFQRYLASGQRKSIWSGIQFSALHREGFEIPVEISLGKSQLSGQQFVTGIIRDISQAKRIQERLRAETERLKALINTVPVAVWEVDLEGRVSFWNKTATLLFGWNADEVVGKPIPVVPSDRQEEYEELINRYRGGDSLAGFETVRRHRNGSLVPVSIWTAPLTDRDGNITRILGVVVDLTQRKHDERALADSEAGFRLLFENNPQPMCVFQAETFQFLEVNRAAVAKYGYTRDEFLSMRAPDIRHPDDISEFIDFHSEERFGIQHVGIWRHRSKSGAFIDVDVISHRLEYQGVPAVLAVLYDVTEQKRLEDQLRQAQKLEAIGQLAGGVAHDFNNLLTAILGYGELLRETKPENTEAVDEIIRAAERAASLTHQLLAFSRRQVLQPQPLNLSNNVSKIRSMLGRLLRENINLVTVLDPDLWNISADPGQIDQIIVNLAVNARDAMERGGSITIQTSNVKLDDMYAASHVGVEPGEYVLLSISDTGAGMTEEIKSRIFEPFFTTKEAGRGTGLGLATVYGIVRQSGGNIWVYSELGKGTTFKIYFPRLPSEQPSEPTDRYEMPESRPGHESILIVEDDPSVRKLVSNMLTNSGYQTMIASNAEEALNICRDSSIHLDMIISDLVLPEIGGRELGERVLELRQDLKLLFMSGYTEHAVLQQNVFAPGTSFIQKPFTRAALAGKIREILDGATH